jgi:muconate cycloisomerase
MKITQLTLYRIQIPFRTVFRHALKSSDTSQSVVVEIVTDSGVHGYGEGTPREYVTGESIDQTMDCLFDAATFFKSTRLSKSDGQDGFSGKLNASGINRAPSARCAMELALLDVWGQHSCLSVASLLSSPTVAKPIRFSGVVSQDDLETTKGWLHQIKKFGFGQVKIKVGGDHSLDLKRLSLARDVLGHGVEIRLDANGSWELQEAIENIRRFSRMDCYIIEQPLAADARDDFARLMEKVSIYGTTVIVDESVCSENDAEWFISNKGASGFNLKISKHGGIWPTFRIYKMARKAEMTCQLGCHVGETALLTAAGRHFALIADRLHAYEGSFGRFLLCNDVTSEDVTFGKGGLVDLSPIIGRAGLGVVVDQSFLRKCQAVVV